MEKPLSKGKASTHVNTSVGVLNDDLLHNILARLDAVSLASAACVNKSWNSICNRVLSRPKIASALSLNPSLDDALNEAIHKVLSEPIRPHFAIVNIGAAFDMRKTLERVRQALGYKTPVIVTKTNGIIGRDAVTNEFKEVKWGALFSGFDDEVYAAHINEGIVLTIGYLPGLKVEAIPLQRQSKKSHLSSIDSFVTDIKGYSADVSGHPFPVGIIMFGEARCDMKLVLEKLDYAMPMDTIIVGDERSSFVYKSGTSLIHIYGRMGCIDAVALVFARDKHRSSGNIRFHVALSNGVSAVGGRYKTASVKTYSSECATWLTARREGQQEVIDGQRMLDDINDLLENLIEPPDLYIGVIKHRKFSIGAEKPMPRTCIAYHGVVGGDEEYLYCDGLGINTGDIFQFYRSDPNTALASLTEAHDALKNIKLESNDALKNIKLESNSSSSKNDGGDNAIDVFGGLIFACYGRGESFFGRPNVDSSPFLENFPDVPLSGIFCGGEMLRPCTTLIGQCEGEGGSRGSCCLHVYSTVYLVMSFTPL